jgi:hypothetical protein
MCSEERPGWGTLVANWREHDGPLAEKVRLAVRNTWAKVRTRSSCCGNYGEPGC